MICPNKLSTPPPPPQIEWWPQGLSDYLKLCLATATHREGGPRVVVSTAAFHARVRGSLPGLGGLKETKMFLPHPRVKLSIVGSLRDREVACSASDRQGSNFESCVWRTVSFHSSHHHQEVLLAQFSLDGHKGGLKPDSFHFTATHNFKLVKITHICLIRDRAFANPYVETHIFIPNNNKMDEKTRFISLHLLHVTFIIT